MKKRKRKTKAQKEIEYNNFTNKLRRQELTTEEYENKVKGWCKKHKY